MTPNKDKTPLDHPVMVRLERATYDELVARAEEEDRTIAQEVRRAVRFYLEGRLP